MQIMAQSQPLLLADLTWPEVRERARPGAVVLLPLAVAAAHATEGPQLMSDIHASEDYRAHLTRVFTRRALKRALERARAQSVRSCWPPHR
jgi:hypothetical protein